MVSGKRLRVSDTAKTRKGTGLLVAADRREFAGVLKRLAAKQLDWPLEFSAAVEKDGRRWILTAHGPGGLAARAAEISLDREPNIDLLISTGLCGALDPTLEIGDIVEETMTVDHVVVSAAEKRALRSTGARAVDMESGLLREIAARRGIRFRQLRSVSDTAQEDLPLDFNLYRDREGRFARGRIARAALARPSSIPGMIRLERNCRRASEMLGFHFVQGGHLAGCSA